MLTEKQIHQAALDLHNAEKQRVQIDATTVSHPDMDMDDAYAIQKAWVDMKIEEGREIAQENSHLNERLACLLVRSVRFQYVQLESCSHRWLRHQWPV